MEPLRADVALVRAEWADELGNLRYRLSAQNFNPAMASAATLTIAEAVEVLPVGGIEPEGIHTPHLFVDRLVDAELSIADVQGDGA